VAPVKLMVISDAPTSSTGLGRITRELCERIHEHLGETFDLATFGYGGTFSSKFPWRQYTVRRIEDWITPELPYAWYDHAGDQKGVLLAIWNAGWLPWLADPSILPPSGLRTFLESQPFEKWIYAPIDAEGWDMKLPSTVSDILDGFHRVLHYSEFASSIDLNKKRKEWLPHGIDTSVFYPRDAKVVRQSFIETVSGRQAKPISSDVKIIGIVATNSKRKDWGLALEACAVLRQQGVNIGVWAHTDAFQKDWDLVGMANEFGLANRVIFTNGFLNDETMALAYSGCDVTMGIGAGEGFGYPLAESLACGTPVVHGNYAGGAEIVPMSGWVEPVGWKWDGGKYINRRPVFSAAEWANTTKGLLLQKSTQSLLESKYSWENLWPKWEKWFLDGVNG
jgi:glycosyltransferase involved in cell wall biosynthesis